MPNSRSSPDSAAPPHVVIVGCGFGGLAAARDLGAAGVRVTVVDRTNHHLFQPLLYQVATAGLAAPAIAAPIRHVLRRYRSITVLLAEVLAVEAGAHRLVLDDNTTLNYDFLVLAPGSTHSYFGRDEWARFAPGLKTLDDALEIRNKVLLAFEYAERERDPQRRAAYLTFVVVGGGPTGVELAGTLAEIARHTLPDEFRHFDTRSARVILLEGGDRLLTAFPPDLSENACRQLERLGVEVRTNALARNIDERGVDLAEERIEASVVLWAAGVAASPLARGLGAPLDRAGRVQVEADLSVPALPHVFIAGDLACVRQGDRQVPGVAQAAKQMGQLAATNIRRRMRGESTLPFRYRDYATLATIGRDAAVAVVGRLKLTGFVAWLFWVFLHIFFLIGFRNRVVVMLDWAWAYATFQRYARIALNGRMPARPETARPDPGGHA